MMHTMGSQCFYLISFNFKCQGQFFNFLNSGHGLNKWLIRSYFGFLFKFSYLVGLVVIDQGVELLSGFQEVQVHYGSVLAIYLYGCNVFNLRDNKFSNF